MVIADYFRPILLEVLLIILAVLKFIFIVFKIIILD